MNINKNKGDVTVKIGSKIIIKNGASEWMKKQGFWLECMPDNIDGMEGKITNDYTVLKGNDSHYAVDLGFECEIGIHPNYL
jgi:hypothetical protein